ncbi:sensor histidine kinase [Thalassomonas haliotis]|uniref:histidine kinase n=1 Tax=Thalassomonas haliotis TaxID=485448 RepID=A0ABY7VEM5_9GAMM|nr:ATP-binding protein [Thalassomonas haliotis]WDE11895.1 two-component sensor histidine kinase [Thalassomonas haliotis]
MRTLTFSLLAVIFIATLGLGWLFDRVYEQYNASETSSEISAVSVLEKLGLDLAVTLEQLPNKKQFIELWSTQHQYQLSLVALKDFPLPEKLLDEVKSGKSLLLETNNNLAFHYYLPGSEQLLVLKSPLLNIDPSMKPQNYIFTLLFYFALLLLFLLWLAPLVYRLLVLRRTAKSFGEGLLNQRINTKGISYIRDIEIEFNFMAQRIEDLIADVKLLSSAVSHDLRTPLARIRFGIDTLQEEDDPILRRRFEKKISNNVDEMTSLVETLLSYARLDQAMLELKKERLNLSDLVEFCLNNKKSAAVHIQWIKDDDISLFGDKRYMVLLLNNLLQNAINYGDGQVSLSLISQQTKVVLTIEDNGAGIPLTEQENILKPFVRGKGDNNAVKGHGIGLAIVKRIIDWHQGELSVGHSAKLGGAKFTVLLPTGK